MLDWLIVGGGVHGAHLAIHLLAECGVRAERLRILDPHPRLVARWSQCTENTGMRFLRSPLVHNLAPEPFALRHFVRTEMGRNRSQREFLGKYKRPSLALFARHAEHLAREHGLHGVRIEGRALGLARVGGGVRVETGDGSLETRRVLLAIGMSEQPCWPGWARDLQAGGAAVDHVFDPGFHRADLPAWRHAVVVGGGITAAQTAMALAARQPGTVTWLPRHSLRVQQFDSEPGWLGPRFLAGFHRERDLARRRSIIRQARYRGSVPPDVAVAVRKAMARGELAMRTGQVQDASVAEDGAVFQYAAIGGGGAEPVRADRVVLATGFEPGRPGAGWLDEAVEGLGLPCAACGFPRVDRSLRWAPGIYVTGPLAELEIGPASRNIAGARMAAQRLAHSPD